MLLATAAAPASAAAGPGVQLSVPGGGQVFVAADELQPGAPGTIEPQPYTVRVRPGEAGEEVARGGLPVRALIERAGVDPGSIGYLTVVRPDGTTAYLPGSDFAEPSPFEGGKPALVSVDVASTRFFRPVFGGEDVNAEDNIATASGEALVVGLRQGNVLKVEASAKPSSAAAGKAVRFSASASGALAGEQVTFRWSFGDGASAAGATVSHTFSGSGTYRARAMAVGSAESGGESGPVNVVVGEPQQKSKSGSAGKKNGAKSKSGAGGPSGKGGEGSGKGSKAGSGNGAGTAPGGGAADGTSNGSSSGTGAETGTGLPAVREPSTVAPSTVTPTAPLPLPQELAAPPQAPAPEEPPPAPAQEEPRLQQPPATAPLAGETVEGLLVADSLGPLSAAELAEAAGSAASQSAPSAAADATSGGASVSLAALIVVALLAGGVLLEWRAPRRRSR